MVSFAARVCAIAKEVEPSYAARTIARSYQSLQFNLCLCHTWIKTKLTWKMFEHILHWHGESQLWGQKPSFKKMIWFSLWPKSSLKPWGEEWLILLLQSPTRGWWVLLLYQWLRGLRYVIYVRSILAIITVVAPVLYPNSMNCTMKQDTTFHPGIKSLSLRYTAKYK